MRFPIAMVLALSASSLVLAAPQPRYVSGANLPTQEAYRPFVQQQIGTLLRDPYSAVFEFEPPEQITCNERLFHTPARWQGWKMAVWVNAKNLFGGYVGRKRYLVIFVNDGRSDGIEVYLEGDPVETVTCRVEAWSR
jgi:hypothetical protein